MSTHSSLPRVNTSLVPPASSSRSRAESGATLPQTIVAPQSFQQIGGFALAAIAHLKPPVGTVKS